MRQCGYCVSVQETLVYVVNPGGLGRGGSRNPLTDGCADKVDKATD